MELVPVSLFLLYKFKLRFYTVAQARVSPRNKLGRACRSAENLWREQNES